MDPVIEIKMPEEKTIDEPTAVDQALEILEVATTIAEKIDEAGDDDDGVIRVLDRLSAIEAALGTLFVRLDSIADMVKQPEPVVVEVEVEEEAPETSIENLEVSGDGDVQVEVEPEEVGEVKAPEIKKKKQRKWL